MKQPMNDNMKYLKKKYSKYCTDHSIILENFAHYLLHFSFGDVIVSVAQEHYVEHSNNLEYGIITVNGLSEVERYQSLSDVIEVIDKYRFTGGRFKMKLERIKTYIKLKRLERKISLAADRNDPLNVLRLHNHYRLVYEDAVCRGVISGKDDYTE